jgi:hypothetical protein
VNPFQSLPEYEEFIYTLQHQFPAILSSTLVVIRRGATLAIVKGEIRFKQGYALVVEEHLVFESASSVLVRYGYEIWHGAEKLYWYDSQPHPTEPSLAITHPHHKHIPPDMKHNRIPAPGLSFSQPNLPFLIHEIESLPGKASDAMHPS